MKKKLDRLQRGFSPCALLASAREEVEEPGLRTAELRETLQWQHLLMDAVKDYTHVASNAFDMLVRVVKVLDDIGIGNAHDAGAEIKSLLAGLRQAHKITIDVAQAMQGPLKTHSGLIAAALDDLTLADKTFSEVHCCRQKVEALVSEEAGGQIFMKVQSRLARAQEKYHTAKVEATMRQTRMEDSLSACEYRQQQLCELLLMAITGTGEALRTQVDTEDVPTSGAQSGKCEENPLEADLSALEGEGHDSQCSTASTNTKEFDFETTPATQPSTKLKDWGPDLSESPDSPKQSKSDEDPDFNRPLKVHSQPLENIKEEEETEYQTCAVAKETRTDAVSGLHEAKRDSLLQKFSDFDPEQPTWWWSFGACCVGKGAMDQAKIEMLMSQYQTKNAEYHKKQETRTGNCCCCSSLTKRPIGTIENSALEDRGSIQDPFSFKDSDTFNI